MDKLKAIKASTEKLVRNAFRSTNKNSLSVDKKLESTNLTSPPRGGEVHRIAEPHIRPHTVKGKRYYYYCNGTETEIYLGSADAILQAVMKARGK